MPRGVTGADPLRIDLFTNHLALPLALFLVILFTLPSPRPPLHVPRDNFDLGVNDGPAEPPPPSPATLMMQLARTSLLGESEREFARGKKLHPSPLRQDRKGDIGLTLCLRAGKGRWLGQRKVEGVVRQGKRLVKGFSRKVHIFSQKYGEGGIYL